MSVKVSYTQSLRNVTVCSLPGNRVLPHCFPPASRLLQVFQKESIYMITSRQRIQAIVSASLLASAAFSASAQTPSTIDNTGALPGSEHRMNTMHDSMSAKHRQERRATYLAELKAKLQINTSQESAWTAYATALQLRTHSAESKKPEMVRADFEKMTTPQRLDRMQARQAEHAAAFGVRADATRAFYAGLTPAQQKTFDAESLRHSRHSHAEHRPWDSRG